MLCVKIIRPDTFILQYSVVTLDKCVNSALANNLDYSCSVSIGIIGLFTLIVASFLLKNASKLFISTYLLSLVTLLISTALFPWELIQKTPLNIIQFPWRLTEFTSLFLSILLVLVLQRFSKLTVSNVIFITLLTVIIGFTTNNLFVQSQIMSSGKACSSNDDFVRISREVNTKDYYPQKASADWVMINPNQWGDLIKESVINKKYFINNKIVKEQVSPHEKNVSINLTRINHSYELNTPILYYEGNIAKVDGKVVSIKQSNRGTMIVDIPKNSHKLLITNHYTKTAKFAAMISLFSVSLIVGIEIMKKFKLK